MDWSNERYVRLYTRDTATWRLLGWEGQAVLALFLRHVDRSGVFDLGGLDPGEAVTAVLQMPEEIVSAGLGRLLKRGVVEAGDDCLVLPNFLEAQEATQSDAQRQRESRERRRAKGLVRVRDGGADTWEHRVTDRDHGSHDVTMGHDGSRRVTPSVPSVPSQKEEEKNPPVVPPAGGRVGKKKAPPWRAETIRWFYEAFWPRYPVHEDEDAARRAILSLRPSEAQRGEILANLETWRKSRRWRDGYVMACARWVRDGAWRKPGPDEATRVAPGEGTRDDWKGDPRAEPPAEIAGLLGGMGR